MKFKLSKFKSWIPFALIFFGVLFLFLSFYLPSFYNPQDELHKAAVRTKSKITELENKFQRYSDNLKTDGNYLSKSDSAENLFESQFTILYYVNDSLVYWNNNKILPRNSIGARNEGYDFHKYKNGYYLSINKVIEESTFRKRELFMMIPIRDAYVTENQYLKHEYNSAFSIPEWVNISDSATPLSEEVKSLKGKKLFYLSYALPFNNQEPQTLAIVFYFLSLLLLLTSIHHLLTHLLGNIWSQLKLVLAFLQHLC